jgi:hypothetical protein
MVLAPTASTANDAFLLYRDALEHDALIQSSWHRRNDDGRECACALGVLGPKIDSVTECPTTIMPR